MQINLSDSTTQLLTQQAAAAGFSDQIDAYVVHLIETQLIESQELEQHEAPPELSLAAKRRDELDAMISAGIESGPATPMTKSDWQRLHARVDEPGHPIS